ncbi:hypothetical protein DABAL43B_0424 [Psychrobacter sp. DAB_AL43B]|nr:hypothetical protein DABAL43B_0424 [Psychrobacter sp. DAB_AL43B]
MNCCQPRGALLPHPFTLTDDMNILRYPYKPKAVFSLLHWSSSYPAQPLAGTLPYVARTFLPCMSVASVQRRLPSLPSALL